MMSLEMVIDAFCHIYILHKLEVFYQYVVIQPPCLSVLIAAILFDSGAPIASASDKIHPWSLFVMPNFDFVAYEEGNFVLSQVYVC